MSIIRETMDESRIGCTRMHEDSNNNNNNNSNSNNNNSNDNNYYCMLFCMNDYRFESLEDHVHLNNNSIQ